MSSTIVTLKYIKEAQYNSKLFKVCVKKNCQKLNKMLKTWDDETFIYLKDKYLDLNKEAVELMGMYDMKLYFDEYTNNDDETIVYINKIRYKPSTFVEKHVVASLGEDSDDDW